MTRFLLLFAFAVARVGISVELPPAFEADCADALAAPLVSALAVPWNEARHAATSAADFRQRIETLPAIPRYGVTGLTAWAFEPQLDREGNAGNAPSRLGWSSLRYHPDTIRSLLLEAEADGAVIGWRALRQLQPRGFEVAVDGKERSTVVFERHRRASIVAGFRDLAAPARWSVGFNWLLPFFEDTRSASEIDPVLAWFFRTFPFDEDNGYGDFVRLESFLLAANGALPRAEAAYLERTRALFVEALRAHRLARYYSNWVAAELRGDFETRNFGVGAMPALFDQLADAVSRNAVPDGAEFAPREAGRYLRFFARDRILNRRDTTSLPELLLGQRGTPEPSSLLLRKAIAERNQPARIRLAQTLAWAFCELDKIVARHSSAQFQSMAQQRLERFYSNP